MNIQSVSSSRVQTIRCTECAAELGTALDPYENAIRREQPSTAAGPGVRVAPEVFTDRSVVLRQQFCPNCLVLLNTEIVPADEPEYRTWTRAT